MRKISQPIDLRSRCEMTDYLRNHFRYSTMNSWNHATSYACNLKIYRLGLDPEIESKLFDMLDTREFLLMRQETLYLLMQPTTSAGRRGSTAEAAAIWSSTMGI